MSKRAYIDFENIVVIDHRMGTGLDALIADVHFILTIIDDDGPDKIYELTSRINQPEGEGFLVSPIEVFTPENMPKNINYMSFRDAVESYYRSQFGPDGKMIKTIPEANVTMTNIKFIDAVPVEIELDEQGGGW